MHEYVHMWMCTCVCVHMRACIWMCVHVYLNDLCVWGYRHVWMHVHVNSQMCPHTKVCTCMSVCVRNVRVSVCMHRGLKNVLPARHWVHPRIINPARSWSNSSFLSPRLPSASPEAWRLWDFPALLPGPVLPSRMIRSLSVLADSPPLSDTSNRCSVNSPAPKVISPSSASLLLLA